ncbi:MAG: hypothetical protein ACXACP_10655 [Candidatus Hodarchaeales archaeon]|jgi:hypothetical protein
MLSNQEFWKNLEQRIGFYYQIREERQFNPLKNYEDQINRDMQKDYQEKLELLLRMKHFYDVHLFKRNRKRK